MRTTTFLLSLLGIVTPATPFNTPPGVDVWCGKAYRPTNSSFDPGGWLDPPQPTGGAKLNLDVYSRYEFYIESETRGSFVVDAKIGDGTGSGNETVGFKELQLKVWDEDSGKSVVEDVRVSVNATGVEVPFDLGLAKKSSGEILFRVLGTSPDGKQRYEEVVKVVILPDRSDGGSMARVDRLNGGIYIASGRGANGEWNWKAVLPMGFYTRWDWISWLVDPANNPVPPDLASNGTKSLKEYKERGYNLIHPVPPGGWASFDTATFEKFLTVCDELELYVMYDMRHTYLNLSSISYQLPRLQSHPSLLLYYTGDEPDGWTDPLNGTSLAYNRIKQIDPYHPVSLVLNCYNFYFKEYTSGADIILEDTYPLIKSSTFSTVYNTPCNRTYGDCGCDFCHVNDTAYPQFVEKPFQDVVDRVDNFYDFQRWIGQKETKPVWGVPQWFYDKDSFWTGWATREEALVMALLRVNHGAKGIVGWLFPTSPVVEQATTEMAKVFEREDITRLLVEGRRQRLEISDGNEKDLDVAAWVEGDEVLIVIVWPKYGLGGGGSIRLPTGGKSISNLEVLFGAAWSGKGDVVSKESVGSLEVSILKATLGGY